MSRIELAPGTRPLVEPQRTWGEWLAWIATEDHCEWANKYVAWFKTPLGVLFIGAVSSLLCGLFVAPQGYVLLAAIVAVVAVGLVWPMVAIRGVSCRFEFDGRRGREGQPSFAKLTVTNRWPWPLWGLSVDDPVLASAGESVLALARVGGWSSATFNVSLTPAQRGVFPDREVRLGTGFPFGLYEASRPAEVPRQLIVWPQTFWLPSLGLTASRSHWRGAVTDRRTGTDGTRLGVRDHRNGDSLRDVHWAKTARYDRLIVSERESTSVEEATVVVDIDPTDPADANGAALLEWRLRIAASICESFAANHGQVHLRLGGLRMSCGLAANDLERLLDELARFDAAAAPSSSSGTDRCVAHSMIKIESSDECILLRRGHALGSGRLAAGGKAAWIVIRELDDVPGQVLRGWRLTSCGDRSARRPPRAS